MCHSHHHASWILTKSDEFQHSFGNLSQIGLAFFNIFILAFIIEKYSQNVFLSWILFLSLDFYGFYFNCIRQALAMTLLFLSFHFLYEKKIKTSFLIYFFQGFEVLVTQIFLLLGKSYTMIFYTSCGYCEGCCFPNLSPLTNLKSQ